MSPIREKDERGKFTGVGGWTSEEAREAGKKGQAVMRQRAAENFHDKADAILRDLGIEGGWEGAGADLRALAEQAARGGAGVVAAINALQRQTGNLVKTEKTETPGQTWNPESGDPCPLCGGNRVTIMLDDESLLDLAEILHGKAPMENGAAGVVDG